MLARISGAPGTKTCSVPEKGNQGILPLEWVSSDACLLITSGVAIPQRVPALRRAFYNPGVFGATKKLGGFSGGVALQNLLSSHPAGKSFQGPGFWEGFYCRGPGVLPFLGRPSETGPGCWLARLGDSHKPRGFLAGAGPSPFCSGPWGKQLAAPTKRGNAPPQRGGRRVFPSGFDGKFHGKKKTKIEGGGGKKKLAKQTSDGGGGNVRMELDGDYAQFFRNL